jgi:WD40 repeat protein
VTVEKLHERQSLRIPDAYVVILARACKLASAGPTKAGVWAAHESGLRDSFLYFVRGNEAPIVSVAFSPHGWELATAARDGSIRLLDCNLCGNLPQLESFGRARLAALRR